MRWLVYDWQPSDWILFIWILVTGVALAALIAWGIKTVW